MQNIEKSTGFFIGFRQFCLVNTTFSEENLVFLFVDEGRIVDSGVLTNPGACTTMLVEVPEHKQTQIKVKHL